MRRVAPAVLVGEAAQRSPNQTRAVVLIHGLGVHPIIKSWVEQASYRSWQLGSSPIVKKLSCVADVYALAYSQNAPVDQIPDLAGLSEQVAHLRRLGYTEIILVGHSAGGLIARHLVEDHPDVGVSRVIQVCSPNYGSGWARVPVVRANQIPFLYSMTASVRKQVLSDRVGKRIPEHVEFACVVGTGTFGGDGVVACRNQWSEDLQNQGIPVFPVRCNHYDVMLLNRTADLLVRLVRDPLPRLDPEEVAAARRKLHE
jgi:pimeloyl-ACP methyl ester carboxylesterase